MSQVTVRTWVERIDDGCLAACASFEETWRGAVYGAGTMLLCGPREGRHKVQDLAASKLLKEVIAGKFVGRNVTRTHNNMPMVAWLRDERR